MTALWQQFHSGRSHRVWSVQQTQWHQQTGWGRTLYQFITDRRTWSFSDIHIISRIRHFPSVRPKIHHWWLISAFCLWSFTQISVMWQWCYSNYSKPDWAGLVTMATDSELKLTLFQASCLLPGALQRLNTAAFFFPDRLALIFPAWIWMFIVFPVIFPFFSVFGGFISSWSSVLLWLCSADPWYPAVPHVYLKGFLPVFVGSSCRLGAPCYSLMLSSALLVSPHLLLAVICLFAPVDLTVSARRNKACVLVISQISCLC